MTETLFTNISPNATINITNDTEVIKIDGNFDKKLDVKIGDEIEELANSFNTMTDNLKTYMTNLEKVTAAEERIATELKVATNIQLSALPHGFFEGRSDFELYATMHAVKEVGGDFYAVMALANQQLCQGNDETMFITVFLVMLDLKTGKLIYVTPGTIRPYFIATPKRNFII